MDPVEALTRLGGVASTKDLEKLSSRAGVRTALKRRDIIRAGRNRLTLPTVDRAHTAARAVNGYVSHLSAAAHHGWEIKFPPDRPQVTVPRARKIPEDLEILVELFHLDIPAADRDGWATTKLRTVVDCGRDLPLDDALCVADSALRHKDLSYEELNEAAAKITGRGAEQVRLVARYADGARPTRSSLSCGPLPPSPGSTSYPSTRRSAETCCFTPTSPTRCAASCSRPTRGPGTRRSRITTATAPATTQWSSLAGWFCGSPGSTS
jgi:hypothetical protein